MSGASLTQEQETDQAIDQTRCPLCGESNACGVASGADTCWCFSAKVPADVRERVPPASLDRACICERCVAEGRGAAETKA